MTHRHRVSTGFAERVLVLHLDYVLRDEFRHRIHFKAGWRDDLQLLTIAIKERRIDGMLGLFLDLHLHEVFDVVVPLVAMVHRLVRDLPTTSFNDVLAMQQRIVGCHPRQVPFVDVNFSVVGRKTRRLTHASDHRGAHVVHHGRFEIVTNPNDASKKTQATVEDHFAVFTKEILSSRNVHQGADVNHDLDIRRLGEPGH